MNALLAGLVAIFLWGGVLPVVKIACEGGGALMALAVIQGLAGLIGVALMLATGRLPLASRIYLNKWYWIRLALYAAHIISIYFALNFVTRNHMPEVLFCNYLWPTFVLLYSALIAGVVVYRRRLFIIGLFFVVVALFVEIGLGGRSGHAAASMTWNFWSSIGLAFSGAHAWGLYSALTRRFGEVSGGGAVVPTFMIIVSLVVGGVLFVQDGSLPLISSSFSFAVALAALSNVVAYWCWDYGMRHGDVVVLSLLADFIPWISLTVTALALGVTVSGRTMITAGVLVAGALITRKGTIRPHVG